MKTILVQPLFGLAIALAALAAATPAEARTVQEFLADCPSAQQANDDACSYTMLNAEIDAHADDSTNRCDIPAPEKVLPDVDAWLRANPQVHPDDTEAAMTAAIEALYCRSGS